ncbi:MAG TPA: glycosyltransferase family 9 protein [Rhodanobacter sp.]|nr:glycosyltransferase family 9 protein [Rhodanobacter sp.]
MRTTCSPVVVRFGRLGDTVLLQPLLHKLCLRYGQPCHLLALGDWPLALFSAQPEVGHCIPLTTQYGPLWMRPGRWRATFELSRLHDCPFYIAEPAFRARTKLRPMLKLAGIVPEHCQFIEDLPACEDEHWLDWLARFSDTTPTAFRERWESGSLEPCGAPELRVSEAERADGKRWLRARGLAQHPLVLLQPANKRTMRWNGVRAAADDVKSWPAERWAAVARAIRQQMPQTRVLLCGSPAEAGYLRQLQAVVRVGTPDVEVAALPLRFLKALLETAHSMISVDTGPAHLAAALGCPLVVLFGGRSPRTWAPRSGRGSEVAVLGGLPDILRVDQIEVEQVVQAWRRLPLCGAAATAFVDGDIKVERSAFERGTS